MYDSKPLSRWTGEGFNFLLNEVIRKLTRGEKLATEEVDELRSFFYGAVRYLDFLATAVFIETDIEDCHSAHELISQTFDLSNNRPAVIAAFIMWHVFFLVFIEPSREMYPALEMLFMSNLSQLSQHQLPSRPPPI